MSASWQKGQRDAVRIFNDFLKQDEEFEGTALTWENLGSDVLCGFEIYERFAFFLVYTYKISANRNTGSFLAEASALNHLGAVMQLGREPSSRCRARRISSYSLRASTRTASRRPRCGLRASSTASGARSRSEP